MKYRRSLNKCEESGGILPVSFIVVVVTAFLPMALAACNNSPNSDMAALVALYDSTNGRDWTHKTNWLSDEPLGEWYGVTTDATGRVVELDLNNNYVNGEFPPELAKLAELRVINLSVNRLSGELPPELGRLAKLRVINLYWNALSGKIPAELGKLADLEILRLQGNSLSGEIPPQLGELSNLKELGLGGNPLSGPVPPELGKLDKLTYLYLAETSLTGCLPSNWHWKVVSYQYGSDHGDLPFCPETSEPGPPASREALIALYNSTDGPSWLNNVNWLTSHPIGLWFGVTVDERGRVTELMLPYNKMRGGLPSELGNITGLKSLDLHGNYLSGEIPPELGDLISLESLNLSVNGLSGELPPELTQLANLRELHLQANELSGALLQEFGNLAQLRLLSLWNNSLDGCVPNSLRGQLRRPIETLSGLSFCGANPATEPPYPTLPEREALIEFYFAMHGRNWGDKRHWLSVMPVSEWYGVSTDDLDRVIGLEFNGNRLFGEIPPELGTLSHLQEIYITPFSLFTHVPVSGGVTGEIPPELGGLSMLRVMDFREQSLVGEIPSELGDLATLEKLELSGNKLRGGIPPELGKLSNLQLLDLYRNDLSGEIPSELGNLANLTKLDLSYNRLRGAVPPELGELTNLTLLSIEGNYLTGCVPNRLKGRLDMESSDLGDLSFCE